MANEMCLKRRLEDNTSDEDTSEDEIIYQEEESESEPEFDCDNWDVDCRVTVQNSNITKSITGYHLMPTCTRDADLHPNKKQKLVPEIRQSLLDTSYMDKLKKNWLSSKTYASDGVEFIVDPFKVCVISDFLDNPTFLREIRQEFNEVEWNERCMDLYEFYQSKDLEHFAAGYIKTFHEFMKNEVLNWVSTIMGIEFTHISATCSAYTNTDYLLVHDDQREDRMVAFVLYLTVDEGWDSSKGGALQLLASDKQCQPTQVVKDILPANNQLVLFPVTNRSHHQVAEVTTREDCRLSINGWFHVKDPPKFNNSVSKTPSDGLFSDKCIKPINIDIDLHSWINNDYLTCQACRIINEQVEENSEICLRNFFCEESYNEVLSVLTASELKWREIGPPNKFCYDVVDCKELPHVLERFLSLFKSKEMFSLLRRYTDLDLLSKKASMKFELQRWKTGYYALLTDYDWEHKNELDLITYFCVKDKSDVIGGKTQYVSLDEEMQTSLITIEPEDNNLNIVYRDTARFTKYVSKQSRLKINKMKKTEQDHKAMLLKRMKSKIKRQSQDSSSEEQGHGTFKKPTSKKFSLDELMPTKQKLKSSVPEFPQTIGVKDEPLSSTEDISTKRKLKRKSAHQDNTVSKRLKFSGPEVRYAELKDEPQNKVKKIKKEKSKSGSQCSDISFEEFERSFKVEDSKSRKSTVVGIISDITVKPELSPERNINIKTEKHITKQEIKTHVDEEDFTNYNYNSEDEALLHEEKMLVDSDAETIKLKSAYTSAASGGESSDFDDDEQKNINSGFNVSFSNASSGKPSVSSVCDESYGKKMLMKESPRVSSTNRNNSGKSFLDSIEIKTCVDKVKSASNLSGVSRLHDSDSSSDGNVRQVNKKPPLKNSKQPKSSKSVSGLHDSVSASDSESDDGTKRKAVSKVNTNQSVHEKDDSDNELDDENSSSSENEQVVSTNSDSNSDDNVRQVNKKPPLKNSKQPKSSKSVSGLHDSVSASDSERDDGTRRKAVNMNQSVHEKDDSDNELDDENSSSSEKEQVLSTNSDSSSDDNVRQVNKKPPLMDRKHLKSSKSAPGLHNSVSASDSDSDDGTKRKTVSKVNMNQSLHEKDDSDNDLDENSSSSEKEHVLSTKTKNKSGINANKIKKQPQGLKNGDEDEIYNNHSNSSRESDQNKTNSNSQKKNINSGSGGKRTKTDIGHRDLKDGSSSQQSSKHYKDLETSLHKSLGKLKGLSSEEFNVSKRKSKESTTKKQHKLLQQVHTSSGSEGENERSSGTSLLERTKKRSLESVASEKRKSIMSGFETATTSKLHSDKKRSSSLFPRDDSFTNASQGDNTCYQEPSVSSDDLLSEFLHKNPQYKPLLFEETLTSTLDEEDEVYLLEVPKMFNVNSLKGSIISLSGKTKVKIENEKYLIVPSIEAPKQSILISGVTRKLQPIRTLTMDKYVKTKRDKPVIVPVDSDVPVPDFKPRNPFAGTNKKITLDAVVQQRLDAAEEALKKQNEKIRKKNEKERRKMKQKVKEPEEKDERDELIFQMLESHQSGSSRKQKKEKKKKNVTESTGDIPQEIVGENNTNIESELHARSLDSSILENQDEASSKKKKSKKQKYPESETDSGTADLKAKSKGTHKRLSFVNSTLMPDFPLVPKFEADVSRINEDQTSKAKKKKKIHKIKEETLEEDNVDLIANILNNVKSELVKSSSEKKSKHHGDSAKKKKSKH